VYNFVAGTSVNHYTTLSQPCHNNNGELILGMQIAKLTAVYVFIQHSMWWARDQVNSDFGPIGI